MTPVDYEKLATQTAKDARTIGSGEIEHVTEMLAHIMHDIPGLHERKCHDCGEIHWHCDNKIPYVLCQSCGSQDTRKVVSQ